MKLQGVSAINPVTGKEIPIFISDYVLVSYGTGAIMAVPAHDTRDWEFAKKFGLPIIEVVPGRRRGEGGLHRLDETGIMVNSGFLNGLTVEEAKTRITEWLEEKGIGHAKVNYKLRDWVFSRQRYWGEPIPMVVLREVRLGAPAGGPAAPAAARGGVLRAHRQRRIPPGPHDRLGEHHLPPLRRPRQAGDRHHAPVGRFLLVLPALHGPPQRQGPGFPGGPGVLGPGGLVQRRHGAHHPAPALLPVLAQVPL